MRDILIRRLGDLEDKIADKAEGAAFLKSAADELENSSAGLAESIISRAIGDASEDDVDAAGRLCAKPESLITGRALKARLARAAS